MIWVPHRVTAVIVIWLSLLPLLAFLQLFAQLCKAVKPILLPVIIT